MSGSERTRFEPAADPDLSTFWDATREKRLVLPQCRTCGQVFWYPRPTCPRCLGADLDWRDASGEGTVHAVTVQGGSSAVVLVDLDEGVRVMSNTVGIDASDVAVGMRVRLTWEALSDGRHLWLFEPARAAV